MMKLILLTNVFATLFMTGLIWFVQVVHYPLFASVGREQFRSYEMLHQRLTTRVVAPAMLVELATAVLLLRYVPTNSDFLVWIGVGLVGCTWLVTATLSVPAHQTLSIEYSATANRKLVATNWIRTIAWSARGILVLLMTYRTMN